MISLVGQASDCDHGHLVFFRVDDFLFIINQVKGDTGADEHTGEDLRMPQAYPDGSVAAGGIPGGIDPGTIHGVVLYQVVVQIHNGLGVMILGHGQNELLFGGLPGIAGGLGQENGLAGKLTGISAVQTEYQGVLPPGVLRQLRGNGSEDGPHIPFLRTTPNHFLFQTLFPPIRHNLGVHGIGAQEERLHSVDDFLTVFAADQPVDIKTVVAGKNQSLF